MSVYDLNFPSCFSQNSENTQKEKQQTTQPFSGSSTRSKRIFRLTLKPEDFLEDSPPIKQKVPRNLFPLGQLSNSIKKPKASSGFRVNSTNSITNNQPLVSIENHTNSNVRPKLRFTLKPEDFLDTPPKKNKKKANMSKPAFHKQKENNPTVFIKPRKPAVKSHNSGFSFRKNEVASKIKSKYDTITQVGLPSLPSNPDESQPLLNVDEVGEVLIKKQSVFKERRRFFPSIGSIPQTPNQNKKYSSVLNKPSRRISVLKQRVSPIKEAVAVPVQIKCKPNNSECNVAVDKTPLQIFIKESFQQSLLKKTIKNSIYKNSNNCCTPINSNSSNSQVSSIQSFVRKKVASSKKRLLNLASQRIVYSPDIEFLKEERNCDSREKLLKVTKESCDKGTQTDQFLDIFKDLLVASAILRESLQKLGMKID